jgi:hypothetical protein
MARIWGLIIVALLSFQARAQSDLLFDWDDSSRVMGNRPTTRSIETSRIRRFTEADYRRMALGLVQVQRSITEQYEFGDNLMFTLYILKIFAEIGEYDFHADDIKQLFSTITRLANIEIPQVAYDFIDDVEFLRFTRRGHDLAVSIHTLNQKYLMFDLEDENAGGDLDYFLLPHGATIMFREVRSQGQKREMVHFMQSRFEVPLLPSRWFSRFNQIDPRSVQSIVSYANANLPVAPLHVLFEGPVIRVRTGTSTFGDLTMNFREGYLTPGMKDRLGLPLPSIHLKVSHRMLRVKTSISE